MRRRRGSPAARGVRPGQRERRGSIRGCSSNGEYLSSAPIGTDGPSACDTLPDVTLPPRSSNPEAASDAPVRVLFLPDFSDANPYQRELRTALEARGVSVSGARAPGRDPVAILRSWLTHGRAPVVHLHWTHNYLGQRADGSSGAIRPRPGSAVPRPAAHPAGVRRAHRLDRPQPWPPRRDGHGRAQRARPSAAGGPVGRGDLPLRGGPGVRRGHLRDPGSRPRTSSTSSRTATTLTSTVRAGRATRRGAASACRGRAGPALRGCGARLQGPGRPGGGVPGSNGRTSGW